MPLRRKFYYPDILCCIVILICSTSLFPLLVDHYFSSFYSLRTKDVPVLDVGTSANSVDYLQRNKQKQKSGKNKHTSSGIFLSNNSNVRFGNVTSNMFAFYNGIASYNISTQTTLAGRSSLRKDGLIKMYVYENLPDKFTTKVEKWTVDNLLRTSKGKTNTNNNNFAVDILLVNLFKSYPGRTWDPEEADLFVVPYPHMSHCIYAVEMEGRHYQEECGQVSGKEIDELLNALTYLESKKSRHLFILGVDTLMAKEKLRSMPLTLTLGPKVETNHGMIIIPYLNYHPMYQPSNIIQLSEGWWTCERKYSMAYYFGGRTQRMRGGGGSRRFRTYLWNYIKQIGIKRIGTLPFVMELMDNKAGKANYGRRGVQTIDDMYKVYRQSIFCPAFPGDNPPQKRFFDVILSGCLPVVLSWTMNNINDTSSDEETKRLSHTMQKQRNWFIPARPYSIQQSYPFAKGTFHGGQANFDIDYESFVVQVAGNINDETNLSNVVATLESLMANQTEIRRRQLNMMKFAPYMTYGMGPNEHLFEDAFSRIIQAVKHYLTNHSDYDLSFCSKCIWERKTTCEARRQFLVTKMKKTDREVTEWLIRMQQQCKRQIV